ncbi:phage baseplate upper protein [Lactobacillus kefiranofaciens]|uniref:BppU family phage baseplate upper protein n=1 Tax=Lactobacillus kefiranofaciens TaxID=267818 RepID=UPI00246946AF|nr:BppU family phage baseplate upper protein [Lactobacillus kefiranofaciens]MDH5099745.1 phage baseplate upper protein [Lactobacillus kefiranofaciens]
MSLAPITLVTDKSTAVIDNAHRILRQDESGLSITVTVLNEDNVAYNLTGKNLVFCENKQNSKIIIDNGKGDNCGKFYRNPDNDTKGVFTYVIQEDAYSASGKAWFEITDGTTVDSTKNFYFDVEKDAAISVANNDYIGSLKALETAMAGAQSKVTNDLANMEAQITQKIATLQSQWNSELQSIKNKANTDTDAAVKSINDRYTSDFAKLKSDFTSWQTSTIQNYQKQADSILAKMLNNGVKVTDVQKQVDDTIAEMQDLTKHLSNVDFTKYAHKDDLTEGYVELPVEGSEREKLHGHDDTALSFKKPFVDYDATLSKQGSSADAYVVGRRINDLDIGLTQLNQDIYKTFDTKENAQDLKNKILANSSSITSLSGRIDTNQFNITQVQKDVTALQKAKPDLSGYETTVAAKTLSDRIATLENKKLIKASSQDDAIAKSKNSNDEYYW